MDNQNLQLAAKLKKEASIIISNKDIWQAFTKHGKIHLSGSAELDLLVYPDLDVYFDFYNKDLKVTDIFAEAALNIIKLPDVISIRVAKELYKTASHIPKGIYMQIKLKTNSNIWQIDIWHLENQNELNKKLKETSEFKLKLDSDSKKKILILDAKHAIKRPDGSTPSFASYYIYKAVLDDGLNNIDAIKKYITDCKIQTAQY